MAEREPDKTLSITCLVVAFLVGGVILILELLAAGWMAPIFGSGIDTWAVILGVTLFAMAGGYFGGSFTSKKISFHHLPWLISASGVVLLFCTFGFKGWLSGGPSSYSTVKILLWALFLLGPPIFLLSMVSPWLIQLYALAGREAGESSGLIYGVSTVGSVLGALGAGLFLIPQWGLSQSTLFCGWVLVLALLNCSSAGKKSLIPSLIGGGILVLALVAAYFFALSPSPSLPTHSAFRLLWQDDSWYGRREVYEVYQGGRWYRHLLVNGIPQTGIPREGIDSVSRGSLLKQGYVMELLPYLYPQGKKALIIGLGGGLLSSFFEKYHWDIESVEIDQRILDLARKFFYFRGKCHIDDGRRFLNQTSQKYDFLLLDVYRGENIPSHLATLEFFQLVKGHLSPQGILAINLIGSLKGKDTGALLKTLKKAFPHLLLYGPYGGWDVGVLTLFASGSPLLESSLWEKFDRMDLALPPSVPLYQVLFEGPLLTDDANPLSLLRRETARRWREVIRAKYLGQR